MRKCKTHTCTYVLTTAQQTTIHNQTNGNFFPFTTVYIADFVLPVSVPVHLYVDSNSGHYRLRLTGFFGLSPSANIRVTWRFEHLLFRATAKIARQVHGIQNRGNKICDC